MTLACGIDFGTSNSSAAHATGGASLQPIQRGATSVPTALLFSRQDDSDAFRPRSSERYFAARPAAFCAL